MNNIRFLSSFFLFFLVSNLTTAKDSLRLAQVLFRHGDRSAVQAYPNDKAGESIWPQGFGQLSMIGMRQHNSLGQFFRQRYTIETQLLNKNYTKNQIYIRSTDFERTLMSAESDLSGLFPPGPDQQWNDNVGKQWQPIPVHTRPIEKDQLLHVDRVDCKRYNQLYDQLMATKPYANTMAANKNLVSFLAAKSGLQETFINITSLYDQFFCMQQNNLTNYWPNWMNTSVLATLKEFQNILIKVEHSVPEMCKIEGGPIIAQMIKNMKIRLENKEDTMRMYMYSAHDNTVAAYLSALRVLDPPVNPPYISCVMVELYQREDNSYYVQVFFRNDSTGVIPPYKLLIPGCDSKDCDFAKFVEATSSMTVKDLPAACGAHFKPTTANIITAVILSVICVCVVLAACCCCCQRRRCIKKKESILEPYYVVGYGPNGFGYKYNIQDEEDYIMMAKYN